jgi:ABC-type nickel/cobalt efflux system permease component RcnA
MSASLRRLRCLWALLACLPGLAAADTVASLLGNFTINQYEALTLAAGAAHVHYTVVFGQLPALRELHLADSDGDGVTTQQERDAYVAKLAPDFASLLVLKVDGVAVPLRAVRWVSSLPTEQGGFSMRLDIDYDGILPPLAAGASATVEFDNRNYPGRIGWREISIQAAPGFAVFDTDGYANSLTNGLNDALQQLPANGPLDERTAHLRYSNGPAPAGSTAIAPRPADGAVVIAQPNGPSTVAPPPSTATSFDEAAWLQRKTKQLVDLISTPTVAPHVAVLALLVAMVLGALHAFSPGHGKTIVGAYLIGSRSTPRHAVFLGITVTITHTLVVFAVGLATLFASRYILPEQLFPALSLLSGLLVLGMGVVLFMQRWRGARNAVAELLVRRLERAFADRTAPAPQTRAVAALRPLPTTSQRFGITGRATHTHAAHDHGDDHGHAHDHAHDQAHEHAHDGSGLMHSHGGGTMHSHMPPGGDGEKVSWRSLLALGVSGGLVPCPSAMVLLLAAIALNKTFYGLLMVVAFSFGLALTLIAVGFLFLYARSRFKKPLSHALWPQVLPAFSALLITIVGLFLCYGALTSVGSKAVGA